MAGGERRREAKGLAGKAREPFGIPDDHVGARAAGDVKPEVPLGRDPKGERVVVPRGAADEDLHPVRRGEAPRYLILERFHLREVPVPGIIRA